MELFKTMGVCAKGIELKIEGGVVKEVKFLGGCNGNTQGLSALIKGMKVEEVREKLSGIQCGSRGTSCPDQLAQILKNNF